MSPALRVLPHGQLTFTAEVAGVGETVLCLHGFPDTRRTWRHQIDPLVEAGYRVIAPTMRGYEPSSQPADGDYRLLRLAEDVVAWIDHLELDQVHLVGHDWGALTACVVASLAPARVKSLCSLAIPPLGQLASQALPHARSALNLWYIAAFQLRVLPERALLARDGAFVRWLWRRWSPGWTAPKAELDAVIAALSQPGVAKAALAYYRALPDVLTAAGRDSWRLLGDPVAAPTLVLAGARDACMDSRVFSSSLSSVVFERGVRLEIIDRAGHFLHQERPEVINKLLLGWLSEHAEPSGERA